MNRHAVVIASAARGARFEKLLRDGGAAVTCLDFGRSDWTRFDYSSVDFLICWPRFQYSSNHPQALRYVKDNLAFVHRQYPGLSMFPDPALFGFYADKYLQFLFLDKAGFPVPPTLSLEVAEDAERAFAELGSPLVVKNRYGAGGDFVFKCDSERELRDLIDVSHMRFGSRRGRKFLRNRLLSRRFLRGLMAGRPAEYPFLSAPLIAQRFIPHDRDIKTVVGLGEVVEAHWRARPDDDGWKVNIDGGGQGIWAFVPDSVIDLSVQLAARLGVNWLNIDCLFDGDKPLISEFSPIWHHYRRNENENLVYEDDYNLRLPLEIALDLELLITSSFLEPGKLFGDADFTKRNL